MRRRFVIVSVPWLMAVFGCPLVASASTCETQLPPNIRGGIVARELLVLLSQSDTFRHQCRRIAAAPWVSVDFAIAQHVEGLNRAQTLIERFEAGAIRAHVTLGFGEDYLELIPHEVEHVLEQMERVALADEARTGRAWLDRSGGYETRRAITAGIRVRQELGADDYARCLRSSDAGWIWSEMRVNVAIISCTTRGTRSPAR